MKVVIFGLSITSSWGNGHATTYRALLKGLTRRGHEVLFLEREQPWYSDHRDSPQAWQDHTRIYQSLEDVQNLFADDIAEADAVIVGSYVPQAMELFEMVRIIARGVLAFYDIDTPVTLNALRSGKCAFLSRDMLEGVDVYLSFTGGPVLEEIQEGFGVSSAEALYCSVDPEIYYPEDRPLTWQVGYLGTFAQDRQPTLEEFLLKPASEFPENAFVVAGAQYPPEILWPRNVERIAHIPPHEHRAFYSSQRFTLNVTRSAMIATGFSPSVRLFEAAACGVPVISDSWRGLEEIFAPGEEILPVKSSSEVMEILRFLPEEKRRSISSAAREKVLGAHTHEHRARQLEEIFSQPTIKERALL